MLANDIKKGMRIRMPNSWAGTMYDNAKGTIRMAEIEGFVTEIGSVRVSLGYKSVMVNGEWESVYIHGVYPLENGDIASVMVNGEWEKVELSPSQAKAAPHA
jgi:hypothetical protein